MQPSPPEPAPAPLPARASSAALANIIGWPAVALLAAGYLLLIARLTSFPFEDMPDHLARATVLANLLLHHGARWGGSFSFHWQPVPYLLHDLLLTGFVALFGTAAGGVLFNELVLLSLPCALLYYMHLNRLAPCARPWVLLVSLYLSTDWFFLVGFSAFRLAVAMLIVCIALADRLRQRWSRRLYGIYLAVLIAGYFEHLTVLAFLAATLAVSAGARLLSSRSDAHREVRLALPVAVLLVLYFGFLAGPHHGASPGIYSLHWGTVAQKLRGLQNELYRYGGRADRPMIALLAFCLLWPVRLELKSRQWLKPAVLERLALAATFLGIYIVLPATYSGAAYVDVRALPMMMLFLLLAALHLTPADAPDGAGATLPTSQVGSGFASAPALAAAGALAAVNLLYVGWHLEKDNAWMQRYRAVVASIPPGARVMPIYTEPQSSILPFIHAGAFVLLDRQGLIPYLFSGDSGDPMSYFRFPGQRYAPVEEWYLLQQIWSRAAVFSFEVQGQRYRWRFDLDPDEHDWQPAVLAPVDWSRVACEYPYLLVTEPYDPGFIRLPTRTLATNSSAALLAVEPGACGAAPRAAPAEAAPPTQVTY